MIGCNTSSTEPKGLSDAEVIEMIQNAEKIVVPASELPTQSQNILDQEYYEYDGLVNWKASGLGYMTELAGRGHRSGMYREAYFNMEGRKLDPNDRDDEDKRKEEWKCFDFIYPITFLIRTINFFKRFYFHLLLLPLIKPSMYPLFHADFI